MDFGEGNCMKQKLSIKMKILVTFAVLILLMGVTISIFSVRNANKVVIDSISQLTVGTAERAVEMIDTGQFQDIALNLEENEYYHELKDKLNQMRKDSGLDYMYTLSRRKTDDGYEYYYVVDGYDEGEDFCPLGEIAENPEEGYALLLKTFETGEQQAELSVTDEWGALVSVYVPIKNDAGELIGALGADFNASDIQALLDSNEQQMILLVAAFLVISVVVVFIVISRLVKPLQTLAEEAELVGAGDLTVKLEAKSDDEIGKVSMSFNKMVQDLKNVIQTINHNTLHLNERSMGLLADINQTKEAGEQIAVTMQNLSEESSSQFKSAEESVRMMEGITEGIHHIVEASSNVSELSHNTLREAENGNKKLDTVSSQIKTIGESVNNSFNIINALQAHSVEISSILKIIQEISSQTNLLALNASIEAARAGEHGKGFAVVAEEVKKLAEQSSESADSIKHIIEQIGEDVTQNTEVMEMVKGQVKEGIVLIEETEEAFKNIMNAIQNVDSHIHETTATSEEMLAATEEITASALGTTKISEQMLDGTRESVAITNEHYDLVKNISLSIEGLSTMANDLKVATDKFKL